MSDDTALVVYLNRWLERTQERYDYEQSDGPNEAMYDYRWGQMVVLRRIICDVKSERYKELMG